MILERVNITYNNQIVTRPAVPPQSLLIRAYNRSQLPDITKAGYQTVIHSLLEVYVPVEQTPPTISTTATVIQAAWAVLILHYISSSDVFCSETLTGRNIPIVDYC